MHRDLKPHNILMTGGGNIKVIDFGDAKSIDEAQDEEDSEEGDPKKMPATGETGNTLMDSMMVMSEEESIKRKKLEIEEDQKEIEDLGMDFSTEGEELQDKMDGLQIEDDYNPFDDLNARRGTQVGTVNYMAPEMIKNNQAYLATDLWALGCIIFKMLSGSVPFEGT
jgi:serine/threonine protein kinase